MGKYGIKQPFPLKIDEDYRAKVRGLGPYLKQGNMTGTIRAAIDDCVKRYMPEDVQKDVGIKNIVTLYTNSRPQVQ